MEVLRYNEYMFLPGKISSLADKAFGNMTYDPSMSIYDFQYQIIDLKESIKTEASWPSLPGQDNCLYFLSHISSVV